MNGGLLAAYLRSYNYLRSRLLRRTGSASVADDLSQEVFLKLSGTRPARIANTDGYVARIGMNLALDWRRADLRRGTECEISGDIPADAPSAERVLLERERLRLVLEIADTLPPKCREVFTLRKIEGLDQAEIARRLRISPNMVQKHLRKALEDISSGLARLE